MRVFACPTCGRLVTFESDRCLNCETPLAVDPGALAIVSAARTRRCANAELAACNWLAIAGEPWCLSCSLTRTLPGDDDPAGLAQLPVAEAAKRRLVFELLELGLPVVRASADAAGLTFDLLSSTHDAVTTGHADGVITLDLAEADTAQRERRRLELAEPYRTVLGTLRHEVGHYYEEILAPDPSPDREACRAIFGDDRADYEAALDRHYRDGPPADWPQHYVSAYATMHPFEDWAETFAHYLHIRDTLQTAAEHGVRVDGPAIPTSDPAPLATAPRPDDPGDDVDGLLRDWLPLTYALNALSRSMGAPDLYPFVIAPTVAGKLGFVHRLVVGTGAHNGHTTGTESAATRNDSVSSTSPKRQSSPNR